MLKNLKGSPLSVFRHCETVALASPGAPLCPFFEYVIFSNFFKFRFSSTVKEYLTLGSLFAIFETWIWRRLGPVPACFGELEKFHDNCRGIVVIFPATQNMASLEIRWMGRIAEKSSENITYLLIQLFNIRIKRGILNYDAVFGGINLTLVNLYLQIRFTILQ